MLDAVQPQSHDRGRSHVIASGHGWAEYDVEMRLAYADDPESDIAIAVGRAEARVSWLLAHEHISTDDGDTERPWTTVVVGAVAAVLRGENEVQDHYRGKHLVKTSVHITLLGGRNVSTTGSLLGFLPFFRKIDRIERRTLDFRRQG